MANLLARNYSAKLTAVDEVYTSVFSFAAHLCDVLAFGQLGRTPMHVAAGRGYTAIVRMFVHEVTYVKLVSCACASPASLLLPVAGYGCQPC